MHASDDEEEIGGQLVLGRPEDLEVASNDVPRVDEGRMIRLLTCPRASRLLGSCNRSSLWIGLIADDWLPLRLPSGTGEALLGSC